MTNNKKHLWSRKPCIVAIGLFLSSTLGIASPANAQVVNGAIQGETRIIKISAGADAAPQHISLALNKAAIIELDRDARDVLVANPAIADAVVRTPRRIFIMSLKIGQTNAIFLDAQGKQIATLEIAVGSDVSDLNNQISRQLPDANIRAASLNDNVVLGGRAASVQQASQAQELASKFAGSQDKVVNMLSIEERQQVLIKVRVSEMSRTIAKQFGVNAATAFTAGGVPITASTGNQFSLLGRALSDLSGAQVGKVPSPNNVEAVLQGLERIGLARTLAEPNLTAVSGEAAKFLAGGEFPVPTARDRDGNVTITFKPFGVGLSFTPVVLSKGRISLQVSTEVSELTNTGAFTLSAGTTTDTDGNTHVVQGVTLPALSVRRTETTVELPSGGSLAIGGLIQQSSKQSLDAFPGLKELPVLGALFRSRDFQNNETELVVTVTAYLVNPVSRNMIAGPDDGYALPTDLETIFLGRLNAVYGKDAKLLGDTPKQALGYIVQ